ncbi:MAG: T9SS type A sorting domain-containing protein [Candidatus Cloacimonetes bacterium]|nr:T9SS type A sorting domain-containing protein [Candidatus Cloacimonadota bacterium]
MKRNFIIIFLLMLAFYMNAAISYEPALDHLDIHLTNSSEFSAENGVYYSTVAFPAREVSLELLNSNVSLFDNTGNLLESGLSLASGRIELEETMVMRDLIMHRIRIETRGEEAGNNFVLDNAVIRLQAEGEIETFDSISSVFAPLYSKIVDNYETSYLRNLSEMPAKMLIISHTGLNNLSYFTNWKNERGIATEVVLKSDIGNSVTEIKNYIQNVYDTEEHPPDYLLIIGDVSGVFAVPSYYHSSENDVTDHPYTLLDGDDYFPEMIVGRFSIDQADNLNTIISKVLLYEKTPYMDDPGWFERMVVVAGNYGDYIIPETPVTTSMWLAEKAADYGYDDITEIYYWWPDYPTYPGTTEIKNAINAGAGIVTYRGWGNVWGWNYPYFHTENILELTNGLYLPVMTSIVCNTGDFANVNVDPCFGELWLTAGNTSNPKGGVVFVGPSDLNTKTKYNNAIFGGFYQGLLDEGIHTFGTAVLRGKMELYESFPLIHGTGDFVEFYFYVYNILGDPSLCMWTKTPAPMSCDLPAEICLGQGYLDIYIPEIANGMVTARKGDEFLVTEFVRDHSATLYFNAETEGNIDVTVTAVNHLPLFASVEVSEAAIDPVITAVVPASEILAGSSVTVDITLTNQGSESSPFLAELSELTGMAEILSEDFEFGTLDPGSSATVSVEMLISGECLNGYELSFFMTFDGIDNVIKFPLTVANFVLIPGQIVVNDANGVLEPGETSDITVTIANTSSVTATNLTATITSATTALTVNNATASLNDLAAGASAEAVFNLTAEADGFNGRDAGIYLHLEDEAGRIYETTFYITIGVVTNTDPTGPCLGGYYAYDSFDTAYNEAPVYFWEEIDPDEGGPGDVILMSDDQSNNIDIPFDFTYFGEVYDSLTVCSNGWISFKTTWQHYFRNWIIPSALGADAQVCAYWDDLIGAGDGVEDIRLCYYYNTAADYFVIEWSNAVNREDSLSVELFEIVLYDPTGYPTDSGNGIIQVNYNTVNNPDYDDNFCTIGIEGPHQEDGVLYSHASLYPASATPLQAGLAIKYTTEPPDSFTGTDEADLIAGMPILRANYPNPFNPETMFSFSLPQAAEIELAVYNIKGAKVKTIVACYLQVGSYDRVWNGRDENNNQVSSGVYFYKLKSKRHTTTKKCVLMK